jgi:hypothetical protein
MVAVAPPKEKIGSNDQIKPSGKWKKRKSWFVNLLINDSLVLLEPEHTGEAISIRLFGQVPQGPPAVRVH